MNDPKWLMAMALGIAFMGLWQLGWMPGWVGSSGSLVCFGVSLGFALSGFQAKRDSSGGIGLNDLDADEIKALRKRHKLSQSALAGLIRVNTRSVYDWEQAYYLPNARHQEALTLLAEGRARGDD